MRVVKPSHEIYQSVVKDPLPPLVLRVGVVGHRELASSQISRIKTEVSGIYSDICSITHELAKREVAQKIYANRKPVFRLLSSIAEGADRLCIAPGLFPEKHELGFILPFLRNEYAKDFLPQNSVEDSVHGTVRQYEDLLAGVGYGTPECPIIEMNNGDKDRTESYFNCGKLLVEHSDLLIAVVDSGRSDSCTSRVVDYARHSGTPVITIHSEQSDSLDIWFSRRFGFSEAKAQYSSLNLRQELERTILFKDLFINPRLGNNPQSVINEEKQKAALKRLSEYTEEHHVEFKKDLGVQGHGYAPLGLGSGRKPLFTSLYKSLKRSLSRGSLPVVKMELPPSQYMFNSSAQKLDALYHRSDQLASMFADLHRSTFLAIYALGAAALITAAFALACIPLHEVTLIFVVMELLMLVAIYGFYHCDHHQQFHRKWLEYRWLAEFLRSAPYLNLLGETSSLRNLRDTSEYAERELVGHETVGRSWLYIYTEAHARAVGFSHCRLQSDYCSAVRKVVMSSWIADQIDYHEQNVNVMVAVGARIGLWSKVLFFATLAAVVCKAIILIVSVIAHVHLLPNFVETIIALSTAVFPIVASMFFAIRNHAEFDISAQRSRTMLAFMKTKWHQLMSMSDVAHADKIVNKIKHMAVECLEETSEWLEIFEVKEAEPV